jgi:hypothetical protein
MMLPPSQATVRPAAMIFDPGQIFDFEYTPKKNRSAGDRVWRAGVRRSAGQGAEAKTRVEVVDAITQAAWAGFNWSTRQAHARSRSKPKQTSSACPSSQPLRYQASRNQERPSCSPSAARGSPPWGCGW